MNVNFLCRMLCLLLDELIPLVFSDEQTILLQQKLFLEGLNKRRLLK
jgi:hypothetical protein